jgi:hypothetical protein
MRVHHNTERPAIMPRGASFLIGDDGQPQFQYVSDPSSIIGPRPVTDADKKNHPGEWAAFLETVPGDPLSQLDHDEDGKPGGSLPREVAEPAPQQHHRRRGGRQSRQT